MNQLLHESTPDVHSALLTLTVRLGLSGPRPATPQDLAHVSGKIVGAIAQAFSEGQFTTDHDAAPSLHHLSVTDAPPQVVLLRHGSTLTGVVATLPTQVLDVQFEERDLPGTLVEGFGAQVEHPAVQVDPERVRRLLLDAAGTVTWRVELAVGETGNGEGGQWHTETLEVVTFASATRADVEGQAILDLQARMNDAGREVAFITPYHAERQGEDPTPAA